MKTQNIAEIYSTATAWLSGSYGRWMRSGVARTASAALCVVTVGCGAPVEDAALDDVAADDPTLEETGDLTELGSLSQAIRCHDGSGNPNNDPNCPWRFNWSRILPANGVDISHRMAPALCANPNGGWLTVSVDPNNQYNVLQWHSAGVGRGPSWSVYGASRAWNSKPACAIREDVGTAGGDVGGFVVGGKLRSTDGNNNKLFASPGRMGPGSLSSNPTFTSGFALVDPDARSYTTGGLPGMASVLDGGTGAVVMAFMGDDGRTIFAHSRALPYSSPTSPWSRRVTGPVLPAGWTAVGAPTVTRLPVTLQIVVHARNSSTGADRLYETHYFVATGVPGHFSSGIGSPSPSWTQLANLGTIADDPWITTSSQNETTVYFRRLAPPGSPAGTPHQIMQTSGFPLGSKPLLAVRPVAGVSFASAPAATGGQGLEMGEHIVTARTTSNEIVYTESTSNANLVP
jgi:hypothetical protein